MQIYLKINHTVIARNEAISLLCRSAERTSRYVYLLIVFSRDGFVPRHDVGGGMSVRPVDGNHRTDGQVLFSRNINYSNINSSFIRLIVYQAIVPV